MNKRKPISKKGPNWIQNWVQTGFPNWSHKCHKWLTINPIGPIIGPIISPNIGPIIGQILGPIIGPKLSLSKVPRDCKRAD